MKVTFADGFELEYHGDGCHAYVGDGTEGTDMFLEGEEVQDCRKEVVGVWRTARDIDNRSFYPLVLQYFSDISKIWISHRGAAKDGGIHCKVLSDIRKSLDMIRIRMCREDVVDL